MRPALALLLLLAVGCSGNPVTADHRVADRGVDSPVLVWKDLRPDRQPWPEARAPEARVDLRVTDLVPLGYCADGTPMFQCSTQKPYLCNAAKLLEHKCSKCGCPGNEQCITATEACQPVTRTLGPTADSSVSSANPTTNYGAQTTIGVASGGATMAYLDFDMSKIPAKAKIDKATLKLNQTFSLFTASLVLNLISDPWGEMLITYQNAPAVLPNPQATGQATGGTINVDVTTLLQAWVDSPTVLHGIRISATSGLSSFSSRESGASAPALTIIYR